MTTAADAFYRTVKDAPGGVEALAVRMGINAQVLRNKANPNITTNHPTLADVEKVMDLTGDYQILHALAMQTGHVVLKHDAEPAPSDMAILEIISEVWAANGEVGTAVFDTLADGRVEAHEVARVKKCVYQLQRALFDLTARLEGMAE